MDSTDHEKMDLLVDVVGGVISEQIDDPNLDLFDSKAIDSFSLLQIVDAVEEKFKVMITPDDLTRENFSTLNKMLDTIDSISRRDGNE